MKNMNHHFEIEYKLNVSHISKKDMIKFIDSSLSWPLIKKIKNYIHVKGPDSFYKNKDTVLRYRNNKNFHELTIKKRTNQNNITIRNEYEVKLDEQSDRYDILKFLNACNLKHHFTIIKDCWIIAVETQKGEAIIAFYEVYKKGNSKKKYRFLEVEGEKYQNRDININLINEFKTFFNQQLQLNNKHLVKNSLYEIFC